MAKQIVQFIQESVEAWVNGSWQSGTPRIQPIGSIWHSTALEKYTLGEKCPQFLRLPTPQPLPGVSGPDVPTLSQQKKIKDWQQLMSSLTLGNEAAAKFQNDDQAFLLADVKKGQPFLLKVTTATCKAPSLGQCQSHLGDHRIQN